jgi:hypothetical protein
MNDRTGKWLPYSITTGKFHECKDKPKYDRQKMFELSKPEPGELEFRVDGSIWKNGKIIAERATEEQIQWYERRMRGPASTWKRWFE